MTWISNEDKFENNIPSRTPRAFVGQSDQWSSFERNGGIQLQLSFFGALFCSVKHVRPVMTSSQQRRVACAHLRTLVNRKKERDKTFGWHASAAWPGVGQGVTRWHSFHFLLPSHREWVTTRNGPMKSLIACLPCEASISLGHSLSGFRQRWKVWLRSINYSDELGSRWVWFTINQKSKRLVEKRRKFLFVFEMWPHTSNICIVG